MAPKSAMKAVNEVAKKMQTKNLKEINARKAKAKDKAQCALTARNLQTLNLGDGAGFVLLCELSACLFLLFSFCIKQLEQMLG